MGGDKDDLLSERGTRQKDPPLPLVRGKRASSEDLWFLVGLAEVILAAVKDLTGHENVVTQLKD